MSNGMWTAASGASAQAQNLDVIANNLANADTPAYKKDVTTFKEYLATVEREQDPKDIPRGPVKDKDFYPLDGRDQAFVTVDGTHHSFHQGHFRPTRSQLDIALDGPGFLEVSTPFGVRYTRHGSLKVGSDGRLVTSEGYPVLSTRGNGLSGELNNSNINNNANNNSTDGNANSNSEASQANNQADLTSRFISLRDRGSYFSINDQGEIYAGEDLVSRINVVEFKDLKKLKKTGNQIFDNAAIDNKMVGSHTAVRQGVLETSNVNPIEEMTNMIKSNRLFEQDLKSLRTYGELLGREANDIGKL